MQKQLTEKDARRFKKYLVQLTKDVQICLKAIDIEMRKPSTVERGKNIAKICNALEMQNDKARYFGLEIDFRKDVKKDGNKY